MRRGLPDTVTDLQYHRHKPTQPRFCVAPRTLTASDWPILTRECPVCAAPDAFVDTIRDGDEYYVECVNCRVYRASRRAFRLFEYLRGKGDRDSLARLARLAAYLSSSARGAAPQLEYDTWETLGTPHASHRSE